MNQNDLRRLAAIGGMDLTQPSVSFKDFNMFKNKGFDLLQDYQNNNLMQPPVDEEADKKAKRKEGLQNLRDTLAIIGARRSGNYALAEQMKQQVNLRKQQEEQQKKQAERQADIEAYLNTPEGSKYRQAYELKNLLGIDMPAPANRKYEKARDGFFRYIDDGSKVFGGIEVPKQDFEITTTDVVGAQKDERKTFEAANKGVKNFQQLLDAAQGADGAASYALMIKFIKQLDDSVVREGEVATFGGFQGALENFKMYVNKSKGKGFTPQVKANMINLAGQTANRLVEDYNNYRAGKEVSYGAIGFDPNMVFAGLDFNLGDLDLSRQYTPNDFEFIEFE